MDLWKFHKFIFKLNDYFYYMYGSRVSRKIAYKKEVYRDD